MSSRPSDPGSDPVDESFSAVCTILAGPNGSGKSSIFEALKPPGEFVNADVYARRINPEHPEDASLAAGKSVLRRLDELIEKRGNFVYETTLSSNQAITLMRNARQADYQVGLVFVALATADLNVLRVAGRVLQGGHDIPEDIVRRRYDSALVRLAQAIPLAHETAVYDNTERPTTLLLRISGDVIEENNLDEAKTLHVRIADAVAQALSINVDAVFKAARYG